MLLSVTEAAAFLNSFPSPTLTKYIDAFSRSWSPFNESENLVLEGIENVMMRDLDDPNKFAENHKTFSEISMSIFTSLKQVEKFILSWEHGSSVPHC
jgi:hypothetical protein